MDKELITIQKIVMDSIEIMEVNDRILIRPGQERALSNKLSMYLFSRMPGWDVDCEYNRIEYGDIRKSNEAGSTKLPDIIIHKRGALGINNNLLWIEVKIENDSINKDINKLKEFTKTPSGTRMIQYKYGLSLSFIPELKLVWCSNGGEIK